MVKYPMDPYKFESRDIKRRLTKLEKAFQRLLARYDRMVLKQGREDIERQLVLEEFQQHLEEEGDLCREEHDIKKMHK